VVAERRGGLDQFVNLVRILRQDAGHRRCRERPRSGAYTGRRRRDRGRRRTDGRGTTTKARCGKPVAQSRRRRRQIRRLAEPARPTFVDRAVTSQSCELSAFLVARTEPN